MLENFRNRLASVDALPQLAILGLFSGILVGGIMVLFRLCIELPQEGFLPQGLNENYEALSPAMRFLLPALGGLGIGLYQARQQAISAGGKLTVDALPDKPLCFILSLPLS